METTIRLQCVRCYGRPSICKLLPSKIVLYSKIACNPTPCRKRYTTKLVHIYVYSNNSNKNAPPTSSCTVCSNHESHPLHLNINVHSIQDFTTILYTSSCIFNSCSRMAPTMRQIKQHRPAGVRVKSRKMKAAAKREISKRWGKVPFAKLHKKPTNASPHQMSQPPLPLSARLLSFPPQTSPPARLLSYRSLH